VSSPLTLRFRQACSNETELTEAYRGKAWLEDISLGLKNVSTLPIRSITFDADVQPRVTFENILCETGWCFHDTLIKTKVCLDWFYTDSVVVLYSLVTAVTRVRNLAG